MSIKDGRLKCSKMIKIFLGGFLLLSSSCSLKEKNSMPIWPVINSPLAIRMSDRIWLIDMDNDKVVGEPILLNQFRELRGVIAGNVLALPNGKLYITNYSDKSETMIGSEIFVLDWRSWKIIKQYHLRAPNFIVYTPSSLIFVTGANNSVLVIDPSNEEEVDKILCGQLGDSRSIYVVNDKIYITYSHGICIVDTQSNKIINQSPYIEEPIYGSSVVSDEKIYLLHFDTITITDLSTWNSKARITLEGGNLKAITLPENEKAYIAQFDPISQEDILISINTANDNIINKLRLGSESDSIILSKNGKAYITFKKIDVVSVLDLSQDKLIGTINLVEKY